MEVNSLNSSCIEVIGVGLVDVNGDVGDTVDNVDVVDVDDSLSDLDRR